MAKKKNVEKMPLKQATNQNKILKSVLIGFGCIFAAIFIVYIIIYNTNHFTYEGVEFEVVKFCDTKPCLIVYKTSLPVTVGEQKSEYNFYLRNDPRKLKDIPFEGEINFIELMVVSANGNITCSGDGVIAVANMVQLYEIIGTKPIRNESLKCDPLNQYMFVNITESNETSVVQTTPSCYQINVNQCEILPATERFMLESFKKINQLI